MGVTPADIRQLSDSNLRQAEAKLLAPHGGSAVDLAVVQGELKRRADLKLEAVGMGFPQTCWLVWDHMKLKTLPVPNKELADIFEREGYAVVEYKRSSQ